MWDSKVPDEHGVHSGPDGAILNELATGIPDANTMRGMSLGAVNPQKVTSIVGHGPDLDDELAITHLTRDDRARKYIRKEDDHGTDHKGKDGGLNHLGYRRRPVGQTDGDRRGSQTRNDKGNRSVSDTSGNRMIKRKSSDDFK